MRCNWKWKIVITDKNCKKLTECSWTDGSGAEMEMIVSLSLLSCKSWVTAKEDSERKKSYYEVFALASFMFGDFVP